MSDFRILIAEDEDNFRKLLEKVLKKEGYKVYTASSGEEALTTAKKSKIHLLITDIKMHNITGIELLETLKKDDPSVEAIIMTAFASVDSAVQAIKLGARDYIIKPFKIEELIQSVKKAEAIIRENEKEQLESSAEAVIAKKSKAMKDLMILLKKVACSDSTVYISGETGVGKELVAKYIHDLSDRKGKPFIKVNCSALPDTLLESELFGHEKGAFTGAYTMKLGRFELANEGTIFLDEVGDISPLIQLKLLRVIQEKEIERVGGVKSIKLDVRIITATNRNLKELVEKNLFRQDLYYRLNVIPICVPALRERKEDIKVLIHDFLKKYNERGYNKKISEKVIQVLMNYDWPGNIRELENVIERMIITSDQETLKLEDIPPEISEKENRNTNKNHYVQTAKEDAEKKVIEKTLVENNWNVTQSAKILGISRRSLHRKIDKYNLRQ